MPEVVSPPAPAAAPAPVATPHPDAPQPATNPVLDEAFSDLDQFSMDRDVADKPVDQQPPSPVRGKDGKFVPKEKLNEPEPPKPKEPESAKEQPKEIPKEAPKPAETPKPAEKVPGSAPELRKAYENLKTEHATLKKEVETLKTAKPPEDPEKKVLAEKLTAAEKRLQQLDETLRFTNYERSQEYEEKYVKPFNEAFIAGRKKVSSLDVEERAIEQEDPNTGEKVRKVIQEGRPATEADFDRIMSIADDREARRMAKQLFGEDAPIAMAHREKVLELNNARAAALDDYKKNGAEREKQQKELTSKQRAEINATWNALNKASVEKFPHLFAPVEGDEEGNALLQKGYDLVDRAFGEDAGKMDPKELVKLHSAIRNRAAAFGRQVMLAKRLTNKVKELEAKLKSIEESTPGAADGGGRKTGEDEMKNYGESALDRYSQPA